MAPSVAGGHSWTGGPKSDMRRRQFIMRGGCVAAHVRCCRPPLNARAIAIRMQAPMKPAIR